MRLLPNFVDAWPTHLLEKQLGRLLVSGTLLAAVSLVVGLGCTGRQLRDEARTASQQALRVAELRGSIAYLDEWLTASARLAAATGEHHWADRYNEALPKLDAAIAEAAELASPETRGALASTTGEAHRDLVTMERRALSLAEGGDPIIEARLGTLGLVVQKTVGTLRIGPVYAVAQRLPVHPIQDRSRRLWFEFRVVVVSRRRDAAE